MAIDPNSINNLYRKELTKVYSDLDYGLKKDAAGNIIIITNNDVISQSIKTILSTSKGERIMLPEFGSNLKEYIFEPLDISTGELIILEVEEALERWEDRISIIDVRVEEEPDDNIIKITVDYSVNETGEVGNFIGRIKQ